MKEYFALNQGYHFALYKNPSPQFLYDNKTNFSILVFDVCTPSFSDLMK